MLQSRVYLNVFEMGLPIGIDLAFQMPFHFSGCRNSVTINSYIGKEI
jgi:hypothetical protein